MHLDKEHHFIIKDLDETHLLIDESKEELVKLKIKEMQDQNTFVPNKTA